MAVISPSSPSGGRNTGFSYVFNASRSVFQDSVQSIATKNVTRKGKYVSNSTKCNSDSTTEKIKDDVTSSLLQADNVSDTAITVKKPATGKTDTPKSVDTAGPSDATSRTDKTDLQCLNKTVPCTDKQDDLESKCQKKLRSDKGLPASKSDAGNTKKSADVGPVIPTTGLSISKGKITENITSAQKSQSKTTQVSSKPLASHSSLTKLQASVRKHEKPETDSGQTVADKTLMHQINCSSIDQLSEQNRNDSANENLTQPKVETTSICSVNSKTLEEKSKKDGFVNNSLSKTMKEDKVKKNTNVIQQKDMAQSDVGKPEDREKSSENKTIGKTKATIVDSPTSVKSKEKLIANSTNKPLQSYIGTKPQSPSKTSPEKGESSADKVSLVEQTISKYKKGFTKQHIDSQPDKSSEKPVADHQKGTQDTVSNSVPQKVLNGNIENKTNQKSIVKPVKETAPISPNKSSVDKFTTDNKKPETCKKINDKSQVPLAELSVEKSKKDVKNEVSSSRQLTKFQKDATQDLSSTSPVTFQGRELKKESDGKKSLGFQKETSERLKEKVSADKLQVQRTKNENSVVETIIPSAGKHEPQKHAVKCEISGKSLIESGKDPTKHLGDKLQKDDTKIQAINPDATSQILNSQTSKKTPPQEKFEIAKSKVEKGIKPAVKLQSPTDNVISKSAGKPSQDALTDKRNEKLVEQSQKDGDTGNLQQQKAAADKVMNKSVTKTQKYVLSSTTKEQEANNKASFKENVKDHLSKKIFSKAEDKQSSVSKDAPKEQFSEKSIVKLQKDNKQKLSSEDKMSVEKSVTNHSEVKISAAKSSKEVVQDTNKAATASAEKNTISADLRIDYDGNLNGEISVVKRRTDITNHRGDTSETFSPTVVGKAAPNTKVSKLSTEECKKKTASIVSSQTPKELDNNVTNSSKSTDKLPKSKLDFDKMVESKDRTVTTPQPENKGEIIKTATKSSPPETDKLSKVNCPEIPSNKTSGKISEINSLNTLQSFNKSISEFKLHNLGDTCKDTAHQTEITNPSQSISTTKSFENPANSPSIKADFQLASSVYATQEQGVKNRRHSKENRPCSYPSTEHKDFSSLQQRSNSQQSLDYYSRDCTLSAVDYAKSRFQNVQQTPRCDEVIKPRPKHTQMVNEFKSLWENYEQKESGLSMPHPKFRKIHMRKRMSSLSSDGQCDADFPIRPFLTKGSVAERVLLFECCPERALDRSSGKSKSLLYNTWKSAGLHHKTKFWEVIGEKDRPPRSFYIQRDKENFEPSKAAAFCRFSKSSNVHDVPLFHYPKGRPLIKTEIEKQLKEIKAVFSAFTDEKVTKEEFGIITKACNLPLYWKLPLFLSAAGENKPFLKCDVFLQYWRRIVSIFHDEASQFVAVLTKCSRNYLLPDDFILMIQDIIDTHPGLTFLKEATEFHSRYVHTVISRIYYCVNKSWSGKITVAELRKSNFLQIVSLLEKEDDINQITDYFSYEHFYVIYCKFWELDKDHDLFIDKNDLRRHNDGAISSRMIERIFSGAVTRSPACKEGKMSYTDFVWFLFSEEDKRHPRSIEYWFRCMDLDGDGYLSMYEMEYFYEEQLQRMEALNIETLPFKDCLCQMLDMIRPKIPGLISLSDLKKCKMTPLFFDTFFNLEKYLDYEQRDPFASQREQDNDTSDMSDWDRYAAEEYELLVAEEGSSEQSDDLMYEDYNQEEEDLSPGTQKITGASIINRSRSAVDATDEDFAETDLTYY